MKLVEHRRRLETVDELPHCCCCCRIPQIGRARKRSRVENYSEHAAADQDDDPRYQFFLKHLKGNQRSYRLEYKQQGHSVVIKYEGGLPRPQPQPRRSAPMGKEDEPPKKQTRSNSQSNSSSENLTRRNPSNNRQKIEYRIMDPDYLTFLEGDTAMSIYDNHAVDSDEERKQQQQQHLNTGDCSPDVEIMECPPVLRVRSQHHKGSSSAEPAVNRHRRKNSKAIASLQSEFRNQIINLLVKPYDEREYQRLKFDISDRKPEVRHLDLRNGRERSCPKNIRGKCYLDYDPDLKEKLSEYRVDKPRCLNLMRGYFFWVQNVARMGSFQPWKDPECLAVRPARGVRYF